jgi:hypothetical protein
MLYICNPSSSTLIRLYSLTLARSFLRYFRPVFWIREAATFTFLQQPKKYVKYSR